MKANTKSILTTLHVIVWVIFIGLCIKTGAMIYSFVVSMIISTAATQNPHEGLNLSALYKYSDWHYIALVSLMIFISSLKAYIFYYLIQIFSKINLVHPFSEEVASFISKISYTALTIGITTMIGVSYCKWFIKRGVDIPTMEDYLGGGAEFLFFAGVIFFIAQIFKRGIEIQSENELTV